MSRFVELIEELRGEFENAPVAELMRALLERSGYLDSLRAERTIEAEGRIENLESSSRSPPSSTPTAPSRASPS